MARDVAICVIHPAQVDAMFSRSLADLVAYEWIREDGRLRFRIDAESGPRISTARNQVVHQALVVEDATWLLLIDADMTFSQHLLKEMVTTAEAAEVPILGALCWTGTNLADMRSTLGVFKETEDQIYVDWIANYPHDTLVKVDCTGAACLLVHRSVFLEIAKGHNPASPHLWFAESSHNGAEFGEDSTFCIRARAAGYPIHVHTGIEVGHRKPIVLGSHLWKLVADLDDDGRKKLRDDHFRLLGGSL